MTLQKILNWPTESVKDVQTTAVLQDRLFVWSNIQRKLYRMSFF